jgi:hypothetical protein
VIVGDVRIGPPSTAGKFANSISNCAVSESSVAEVMATQLVTMPIEKEREWKISNSGNITCFTVSFRSLDVPSLFLIKKAGGVIGRCLCWKVRF